jgi:hypothetical protein
MPPEDDSSDAATKALEALRGGWLVGGVRHAVAYIDGTPQFDRWWTDASYPGGTVVMLCGLRAPWDFGGGTTFSDSRCPECSVRIDGSSES